MTIRIKLTIFSALIIVIAIVFFGLMLHGSVKSGIISERLKIAESILETSLIAKELRFEYVHTGSQRSKIQWYSLYDSLNETLNQAAPLFADPESKALYSFIREEQKQRKIVFDEMVEAIEHGGSPILIENLSNELAVLSQERVAKVVHLAELGREDEKESHQSLIFIIGVSGLIFIIFAFFSYLVGRRISRSLTALLREVARITALGSYATATSVIDNSNDEFGQLSRAFNIMTVKLREYYENLEKSERIRLRDLSNANIAAQNVLEDLRIEKSKSEIIIANDEAMLGSIGDGLVVVDRDLKTIRLNKAAETDTGWSSKEVIGKVWSEVVITKTEDGESVPLKECPLFFAVHEGRTTTSSMYLYTRKDKTKFPVAITVSPIKVGGEIIGAILVFRDITRERAVDKAKTEFVSLASHQLRTPLSAVNWYTEMLLSGDVGKMNAKQNDYLDEVYRGNKRMVSLVNSLLNVSRLELGTFAVEPEPTDIPKAFEKLIDEYKKQIDAKKIKLTSSFDKNIPIMPVDPKLLHMITENILSNAIKYTPVGGKIVISLSLNDKNYLLMKISDTGCGIPKNQQDKIFSKLFRADNVREKDTEGTGLGLYIAKSIIDSSDGKIWFESEENKGTTFFIKFPITGMKKKKNTKKLT